jgi:hypothetical protein
MKRLFSIIILLIVVKSFGFSQCNQTLVTSCCSNINSESVFLQQFRAKLGAAASPQDLPVARFSALLSKGNTYRFDVCSALDFEGEAILQLYDGNKLIASSYHDASKTDFKAFEFFCSKTAIYKIYISFLDGKQGCAVGVLSMKK